MNTPVCKQVDEALGDIVRNEIASTAKADDSRDSKTNQDTLVMDDPNYIPPSEIDIPTSTRTPFMATSRSFYRNLRNNLFYC